MIGKFLKAWLASETAVTDIIGSGDKIRFWPHQAPQDDENPDRILYTIESDAPLQTLGGSKDYRTAKVILDLQIGDADYEKLQTLTEAIMGTEAAPKLNGYRGSDHAGIFMQCCRVDDKGEDMDDPDEADDEGILHSFLEVSASYNTS